MAFPGRDAADHTNESSICKRPEMARFYAGFSPSERATATAVCRCVSSLSAEVPEKARDLTSETREVLLDDAPDEQEVYAPVAVNEAISKSDDPLPDRIGGIARRRRQAVGSLADDFKIANNRVLDHSLPQKDFAPVGDIVFDGGDGIVDVVKIKGGRFSQRLCLSLDIGTDMGAEASLDDNVDPSGECVLQLFDQSEIVVETTVFCHVDQEVDITIRTLFMAKNRAEQAQVRCAMARGYGDKLLTAALEVVA
jgi:hypothetical protein